MDALKSGSDVVFLLMGAVMVLSIHAGFDFLEVGTVRKKNQFNALQNYFLYSKKLVSLILVEWDYFSS